MGQEITANVVVQGWFNPRDQRLWRAGMVVSIKSPMAMLDMPLGVLSVTFTQDRQSGSRTALELVRKYRLKMFDDDQGAPSTEVVTGDQKPVVSTQTITPS
jgi:prophage tail gpP-like protein